ncbi:AI-2E family transporter [Tropicimonas sp. IMCC34043]|uniref:AI-2E family transporter n=1 Tax=Tropicimonas sp. IMCC34043 TaxID=2248760 RepID=UPI000E239A25|nr:AI-2E family transporter [Tropicimonas sp. IMCC34043]
MNGTNSLGTLSFWRDLLLILTLGVIGLVYGAGFLLPLTFAILVFVLLTAVIDQIAGFQVMGRRVPGWLAHVLGLALVLSGLALMVLILVSQASSVASAIPEYRDQIEDMVTRVAAVLGDESAQSMRESLDKISMPRLARQAIGPASSFMTFVFVVGLYLPFMLLERGPMTSKIAIAAPDEASGRKVRHLVHSITVGLQTYVKVKTFASLLTGVFSYAVMKPMGLQFAETWALLAFALNYIPSVGSILGVVFPSIVALIQFDSMSPFLVIALGCGAVQFVIGNVLEPAIAGRSLNMSPLVIILGLTFWGAVWGIVGTLLSVPITACLMIVLGNIPQTRWLAVLMSGDGALGAEDGGSALPSDGPEETGGMPISTEVVQGD